MTEQELRNRAVAQARSWLGRKEADGSHKPIIDIYKQIRPLPRGYKMKYTDPWCAAFVSAVGQALGMTGTILPECGCDKMIALYKTAKRWAALENVVLKPGDLVFYDWDQNGSADHVGMIEEVTAAGFRVIEGNMSDGVNRRTVQRNYQLIHGFALPDYASAAEKGSGAGEITVEPAKETPKTESFELTHHVLRYGAGMGDQKALREEVRAVQRNLRSLGFDVGPDGLDGEFGNNTRNAVVKYQVSVRLTASGEVDKATKAALDGLR